MSALRPPPGEAAPAPVPLAHGGSARGPQATAGAVATAMAGVADPGVVLIFPDSTLGAEQAYAEAVGAAHGVPVAGMTTVGSLAPEGAIAGGCSALAFGGEIQSGVGVAEDASTDLWAAGRDAAGRALAGVPGGQNVLLILMLDSASEDQSLVAAGAADMAGPAVPIVGGAAGAEDEAQFGGGGWGRDRVVAVAVCSPAPIGVGIADGATEIGGDTVVVSAAKGNVVLELDGRPADEVFLERTGFPTRGCDDERFTAIATVHPLLVTAAGRSRRLRHVFGRVPGGGIATASKLSPGTTLGFTRLASDTIVESTYDAAKRALDPLDGPPRAALVFDCSGRLDALGGHGPSLDAEAGALVGALGGDIPLAGAYTRGEIGRLADTAEGDLQHSLVVAAFG